MTMVDFVMSENWGAAKDTLGLLVVMIEQACLDQGKFDLAQLLTLQEDPPSGVFTNRQLSQVSRAKPFSPLADQRWVTVALAFLKELDTISTKRSELLQASQVGLCQRARVHQEEEEEAEAVERSSSRRQRM